MATASRYSAVVKRGKLEIHGLIAWIMGLVVHLASLAGFKNRLTTMGAWGMHIGGDHRSHLTTTQQCVYARQAIERVQADDAAARRAAEEGAASDGQTARSAETS